MFPWATYYVILYGLQYHVGEGGWGGYCHIGHAFCVYLQTLKKKKKERKKKKKGENRVGLCCLLSPHFSSLPWLKHPRYIVK